MMGDRPSSLEHRGEDMMGLPAGLVCSLPPVHPSSLLSGDRQDVFSGRPTRQ